VKQVFQEILLFFLYIILGFICLPVFLFFVWIADKSVDFASLFVPAFVFSGLIVLVFNIYFARFLFNTLKAARH
jgi:hypothetical protein